MVALSRTPDLLERVIAGEQVADRRVAALVPTVRALAAVEIGGHPDPAFVAALGTRLLAEAAARPVGTASPSLPGSGSVVAQPTPTNRERTREGPHPVIIFVGHGWPRLLAGVVASLLAVAGVVGVASRSALPGQALYPVKQVLESAAVDLAGSDVDKGETLLGQAEGHVVDATRLVDGPAPTADDVTSALTAAIDATTRGQSLLKAAYTHDRETGALVVLRDFSTRLIPQVDGLADRVPPGSVPSLQRLRALLGRVGADATSALAGCRTCGVVGLPTPAGLPGAAPGAPVSGSSPRASAGASAGLSPGANTVVTARGPSVLVTRPGSSGTSGSSGSSGSSGTSGDTSPGGGVRVGGSGVGVRLPGVGSGSGGAGVGSSGGGVSVTLPVATATVGVPGVTAGTGGVGVGGGGVGVGGGGVGLPSATASLPLPGVTAGSGTVGVGGIPVVSSTCVLGVCLP